MKKIDTDFRQAFAKMAPQAIISRAELASLLCTTEGAVSQMTYRNELPIRAFPTKRRACWFVSDIRYWLDKFLNKGAIVELDANPSESTRIGRPRKH